MVRTAADPMGKWLAVQKVERLVGTRATLKGILMVEKRGCKKVENLAVKLELYLALSRVEKKGDAMAVQLVYLSVYQKAVL